MWLPSGKREGAGEADFCMEGIFPGVLIGLTAFAGLRLQGSNAAREWDDMRAFRKWLLWTMANVTTVPQVTKRMACVVSALLLFVFVL